MTYLQRAAGAMLLAASLLPAAQAHVTLEWPAALAGSTYKAAFRISHGCGASPTRQVVVEIPAGVRNPRPMPHAGWTLEIERAPAGSPGASQAPGAPDGVARITWTARTPQDMLQADYFDEFVLLAALPQAPGPLYWPVRQICAEGRLDWVQVPAAGHKADGLAAPAVLLDILPAAGAGGHLH